MAINKAFEIVNIDIEHIWKRKVPVECINRSLTPECQYTEEGEKFMPPNSCKPSLNTIETSNMKIKITRN